MKKILLSFIFIIMNANIFAVQVDFEMLTGNAEFGLRDKGVMIYSPNSALPDLAGRLWYLSGTYVDSIWFTDAWSSVNGVEWVLNTGNAEYDDRTHGQGTYFDGKLWVISGGISDIPKDALYSDDGTDWFFSTRNAEFSRRTHGCAVSFDNKMWLIAGVSSDMGGLPGFPPVYYKESWYSMNGEDWVGASLNTSFPGREGCLCAIYDNKIWLMNGTENREHLGQGSIYYNDVWYSSDGVDWILATGNAEYGQQDSGAVYTDLNGIYFYSDIQQKVWFSNNGESWSIVEALGNSPVPRRDGVGVMDTDLGRLIYASGRDGEDLAEVWSLSFVTITETYTYTVTPTITKTHTITPTVTETYTPTNTVTFDKTVEAILTVQAQLTNAEETRIALSRTPTPTGTPSRTATTTFTATNTAMETFTITKTAPPTETFTISETHTITPTFTVTKTITKTWTLTPTLTETAVITSTPTITLTPTIVIGYFITNKNIFNTEKWGIVTITGVDGVSDSISASGWDSDEYSIYYSFAGSPITATDCNVDKQNDYFILTVRDADKISVDCSSTNAVVHWYGRKL